MSSIDGALGLGLAVPQHLQHEEVELDVVHPADRAVLVIGADLPISVATAPAAAVGAPHPLYTAGSIGFEATTALHAHLLLASDHHPPIFLAMTDPTAAPVSPLIAPLIQFAGALLGAAVGGAITWLTARRKLANERAFDRQLEWHEGMHRALGRAADAVMHEIVLLSKPGATASVGHFSALNDPMTSVRSIRSDAMLFGSPEVVAAVDDLFSALESKMTTFRDSSDDVVVTAPAQITAMVDIYNTLIHSMKVVGAAHRRHLGLKSLPKKMDTRPLPFRPGES